jgi:hypothetical protein
LRDITGQRDKKKREIIVQKERQDTYPGKGIDSGWVCFCTAVVVESLAMIEWSGAVVLFGLAKSRV